ncbi:RNA polymerase sigma factor [Hymenobacter sp. HD11105]
MRSLLSIGSTCPQSCASWDDDALVLGLEAGNERAFTEIYERYWQRLYALAHRKLKASADAEEVVQDVFVNLWHKRSTARIYKLDAYLFAAAKYKIIDCLRARMTHSGYIAYAAPHSRLADRSMEGELGAIDLSGALAASVGHLPENTQTVFRLSREEYQSVPEIAVRLNLAPKTVEYHLTRSLRFLRARLREFLLFPFILAQVIFEHKTFIINYLY